MQSTIQFDIFLLVILVASIIVSALLAYFSVKASSGVTKDLLDDTSVVQGKLRDLSYSMTRVEASLRAIQVSIDKIKTDLNEVDNLWDIQDIPVPELFLTDEELKDFMRRETNVFSSRAFSRTDEPFILEDDGDTSPTNNTNQP